MSGFGVALRSIAGRCFRRRHVRGVRPAKVRFQIEGLQVDDARAAILDGVVILPRSSLEAGSPNSTDLGSRARTTAISTSRMPIIPVPTASYTPLPVRRVRACLLIGVAR